MSNNNNDNMSASTVQLIAFRPLNTYYLLLVRSPTMS